jgi:hypothetical protein
LDPIRQEYLAEPFPEAMVEWRARSSTTTGMIPWRGLILAAGSSLMIYGNLFGPSHLMWIGIGILATLDLQKFKFVERRFSPNVAALLSSANTQGDKLIELWLAGIRGSDLLKALYAERTTSPAGAVFLTHLLGFTVVCIGGTYYAWSLPTGRSPTELLYLTPCLLFFVWQLGWGVVLAGAENQLSRVEQTVQLWKQEGTFKAVARISRMMLFGLLLTILGSFVLIVVLFALPTNFAIRLRSFFFDHFAILFSAAAVVLGVLLRLNQPWQLATLRRRLTVALERADELFDDYMRNVVVKDDPQQSGQSAQPIVRPPSTQIVSPHR